MATMSNPGKFDCMDKLNENQDMPFFVLLASDPLAPLVVRHWASVAAGSTAHEPDKIEEARAVAKEMSDWQRRNAESSTASAPPAWPFPVSKPST